MLRSEAIRLVSQPEQSHEHHDPSDFAGYLGRSPDTASAEDLRRYQLHRVDRGVSAITLNATITGLKFFFDVVLGRAELMAKMRPVRVAQTLPVILSREEVGRLIESARNLKHRTARSLSAHGTHQSELHQHDLLT